MLLLLPEDQDVAGPFTQSAKGESNGQQSGKTITWGLSIFTSFFSFPSGINTWGALL
jgi:hypothetical protein